MNKTLEWLSPYYDNIVVSRQKVIDYVAVADSKIHKVLRMLYLYVTFDCNQQCKYCWLHNNVTARHQMMSVEMIEKLLAEAIPLGLERIKITGGEPFTNTSLNDLANTVLAKGIGLDIETNGTLITQKWINDIISRDKLFLKISLDAASSDIHDNLAHANVFKKTVDSAKLLSANTIKFGMVTVLNRLNVHHFEDIIDFVSQLGASTHRIILSIQPLGRGKNIGELKLNLDETIDVIKRFFRLRKYHDKIELGTLHSTIPPAFIPLDRLNFNACDWGIGLCGVMPDGSITMCSPAFESMDLVAGNIYENSLTEIWLNSDMFSESHIHPELDGVCGKCLFSGSCRGMCRVFARATYGSNKAPYPFCQEMFEAGFFPEWALK